MRYRWRDIPLLFQTPAGRIQLREGLLFRLWPLSSRLAMLHRRTFARRTRVVAIVGSFGKSTTLRAATAALGIVATPTMLNNAWGSASRAMLRIRPGQPRAVIEIGISDKGQMRGYARMARPDITVVTSIGSEHHRSLHTLDVTRDEKAWMVRALAPAGTAVLNGDDANVLWMATQTRARVVTFGFGQRCDVRAVDARAAWPGGMRFRLVAFGKERDVALRLLGRHMVYPALAAVAVAHIEGVPLDDAIARIEALEPTPGRMQPVVLPQGATIIRDEFKSSIETIDAALEAFGEIPARRRMVVLGGISEPPEAQHAAYRRIGESVARVADRFIVAGRMFEDYRSGARRGGMDDACIIQGAKTPQALASQLAALLEPGDVVLLKGRDTERLARVVFILQGRTVRCDIRECKLRVVGCDECAMLERGWGARRVVM
ncbi:MAG: Mur ligase family protein [Betaproteobacteria bacterium]